MHLTGTPTGQVRCIEFHLEVFNAAKDKPERRACVPSTTINKVGDLSDLLEVIYILEGPVSLQVFLSERGMLTFPQETDQRKYAFLSILFPHYKDILNMRIENSINYFRQYLFL